MQYYDFKVFTRVLWQFTEKFSGVPLVNRCDTPESRVDAPESCHTVCLISGRDVKSDFFHLSEELIILSLNQVTENSVDFTTVRFTKSYVLFSHLNF